MSMNTKFTKEIAKDNMAFYDVYNEAKNENLCSFDIKLARTVWDATKPILRNKYMFLRWEEYESPRAAYVAIYLEEPEELDNDYIYANLCYGGLDVIIDTNGKVVMHS